MSELRRVALLVTTLCALSSCSLFRPPEVPPDVALRNIAMEQAGPSRQVFRARLRVSNPNATTLRVSGGGATLHLRNLLAGEGELVDSFSVPAGGSTDVDVLIVTDLASHAGTLLQWALAGTTRLDYRVSGYLDPVAFGIGRQRFEESGELSLADLRRLWQPPGRASGASTYTRPDIHHGEVL